MTTATQHNRENLRRFQEQRECRNKERSKRAYVKHLMERQEREDALRRATYSRITSERAEYEKAHKTVDTRFAIYGCFIAVILLALILYNGCIARI